jgi:hypothetical protein
MQKQWLGGGRTLSSWMIIVGSKLMQLSLSNMIAEQIYKNKSFCNSMWKWEDIVLPEQLYVWMQSSWQLLEMDSMSINHLSYPYIHASHPDFRTSDPIRSDTQIHFHFHFRLDSISTSDPYMISFLTLLGYSRVPSITDPYCLFISVSILVWSVTLHHIIPHVAYIASNDYYLHFLCYPRVYKPV